MDGVQGFAAREIATLNGTLQLGTASTTAVVYAPIILEDGILTTGALGATVTDVALIDGGTIALNARAGAAALTILGNFTYDNGSIEATVKGPTLQPLITLAGTVSAAYAGKPTNLVIIDGGGLAEGTYRIVDKSIPVGTVTGKSGDYEYVLDTSNTNQTDVIVTAAGLYWNGGVTMGTTGPVAGGTGTWTAGGVTNWTKADGTDRLASDPARAAVFAGTAGTVTVSNSQGAVQTRGLKFLTTGYTLVGDSLTLANTSGTPKLNVDGAATVATVAAPLAGSQGFEKVGAGTLVLTGASTFTGGGTTVSAGTLQIGAGGTTGSRSGAITNNATLVFDRSDDITAGGPITGTGALIKRGVGTLTLSGSHSAGAGATVAAGTLALAGGSQFSGNVSVQSGATLSTQNTGGAPATTGTVTVQAGSTLQVAPSAAGDGLTTTGLVLASGSSLAVTLGAPSGHAAVSTGTLSLGGTLDVSDGGGMMQGVYRIIDYATLTSDGGLQLRSTPANFTSLIQRQPGQVNLAVSSGTGTATAGDTTTGNGGSDGTPTGGTAPTQAYSGLLYWNGQQTAANGTIQGGSGTWSNDASRTNWTDTPASQSLAYRRGFVVFGGNGGSVTVDASKAPPLVSGMQFSTNGYSVSGGPITLNDTTGPTLIRVGDGTSAGGKMTATIASELTGTTGLLKGDAGTLILTAVNTYTGGTRVAGGTLQVGADTALGASGEALSLDGGRLAAAASFTSARPMSLGASLPDPGNGNGVTVASGASLTLTGALTGAGGLTKQGAGTLVLSGTNTYAGVTLVAEGTLQLGDGGTTGSVEGTIVNDARLVYARSDIYAVRGQLSGAGDLEFRGGTVKYGTNSRFTGAVTAKDAVVRLDPGAVSASAFTLESGSVLGGTATIGALTANAGSIVAPGYSPGTITVTRAVALNAGSTYAVDVTPDGRHDFITATGPVTISSQAKVAVHATPGRYAPNATYAILTSASTVTGQFAGVTSDYAFLKPTLSYDAQDVYLGLTYNERRFTDFARTRNQYALASGVQGLGMNNRVFDTLLNLPEPQVARAFDRLDGEGHASLNTVIQQQSAFLRDGVGARMRQSGSGNDALGRAAKAAGPATQSVDGDPGRVLWAQAYGGFGRRLSDGNAGAVASSAGGMLAGLDMALSDAIRVGVLGGLGRSSVDVPSRDTSATFANYDVGLYGSGRFGALAVRGGFAQSWHDVSARRSVVIPGDTGSETARYTVAGQQVFGEVSTDVVVGATTLQPFAGLSYVSLDGHRVTERGSADAALSGTVRAQSVTYTSVGARAATQITLGDVVLTPSMTLGWQHAFGSLAPRASLQFAGGSTFWVSGVPVAQETAVVGAGLSYDLSDVSAIRVNYTGQLAPKATQNAFTAEYAQKF